MLPLAEIEPVITNFLYMLMLSAIDISSSDLIYILAPSDNVTADKSHVCHCPSFSLYCITLLADVFGVPFCCMATVLSPVDVKHKYGLGGSMTAP